MQGSSLPPCPPTAIHTWSWQSSASAPLPYALSFPGGTRRKKTGCRGSTRNFPCRRPRREARRHNRKPCLKYSAKNRKIFLRLSRTVNRRQNRRPGAEKKSFPPRQGMLGWQAMNHADLGKGRADLQTPEGAGFPAGTENAPAETDGGHQAEGPGRQTGSGRH